MLHDAATATIQHLSYASTFIAMIVGPFMVRYPRLHIKVSVVVNLYPSRDGKD